MTAIQLILVPYDSGNYASRHGLGPKAFLDLGLIKSLEDQGHQVSTVEIIDSEPLQTEMTTAFSLMRLISAATNQAESNGAMEYRQSN